MEVVLSVVIEVDQHHGHATLRDRADAREENEREDDHDHDASDHAQLFHREDDEPHHSQQRQEGREAPVAGPVSSESRPHCTGSMLWSWDTQSASNV
jgi:hypothetical protein